VISLVTSKSDGARHTHTEEISEGVVVKAICDEGEDGTFLGVGNHVFDLAPLVIIRSVVQLNAVLGEVLFQFGVVLLCLLEVGLLRVGIAHGVSRLLRDGMFNKDITLIDGEKLIASWPKSMN
jgi:hypothetical protein